MTSERPRAESLSAAERVDGLPDGIEAWTTTRRMGSFGLASTEAVGEVMSRWQGVADDLAAVGVSRLASAVQVHGADIVHHRRGWRGWLRLDGVDGHIATDVGTALAVTIADCTPVFVAHPAGAVAALHAGWRGTAAGILPAGLAAMAELGYPADECTVHLGPSICKGCYEVGPEVFEAVTGSRPATKGHLDVRAVLADQALRAGVGNLTVSARCTRCDGELFYSHRGGDWGRQLGIIALRGLSSGAARVD